MAKGIKVVRRAFNAGEVSPQFDFRNDTEKHAFACQKLENFNVSPLGGISRREGTRLLGVMGSTELSDNVRLIPFEYNREFSYILALRTEDEAEQVTWTTGDFVLPSIFSICVTLPAGLDGARAVWKKDNLSLSILENNKLQLKYGELTMLADIAFGASAVQKVVVIQTGAAFDVYLDSVKVGTLASSYVDGGGELVMENLDARGDNWNIKIFDANIALATAYYTLSNYQAGDDENALLTRLPNYSAATSLHGSTIEYVDGQITLTPAILPDPEPPESESEDYGGGEDEEPVTVTDIVSIPFNAKKEATFTFALSELVAEGCAVYIADSADLNTSIAALDVSKTFKIPTSGNCVALKFDISNEVLAEYEGGFVLQGRCKSILSEVWSRWDSTKVIKLDVINVDGEIIAADVVTPIPSDTIHELHFKQVNGYLFVAHSSFAPKRLEFTYDEEGAITAIWTNAATFHPSIDSPEKDLTISCNEGWSATSLITAGEIQTVTAGRAFFTADMIGSQLKLEYSDSGQHTYKWAYRKANNGVRDGYYVGRTTLSFASSGKVTVKPEGGLWEGILILEESIDNGVTWNEIGRSSAIQGSENTTFEREVYNVKSLVRAKLLEQRNVADTSSTTVAASTEGCFFNIYTESTCNAWVEIQTVSADGKSANVKFLNPARNSFKATKVYKSAWSDGFGYPRTVDIHEERLTLGGTRKQPSTVWLSQTNNWDNFRSVQNLDTDPLAYTLASDDGDPISWIVSKSDLMIGLGSSEWSLGSREAGKSLTASIVQASNQSEDGVEYIMPAKAGNMVIFVRRGNCELGSIAYDFASDAYNSISLTTMNPEILGGGVKNIFNQLSPKNMIFAVRKDGVVSVFTYNKENNVAAWSRYIFGDGVISACALSTGGFKSVFLIVQRNGFMCLERLDPLEMKTNNWLDCVPISEDVEIPEGLYTGVPYRSTVRTTPIFNEGNIVITNLEFKMLNAYGGQYRLVGWSADGERLEEAKDWRKITSRSADLLAMPLPRDYRFIGTCDSGYLEEVSIEIETTEPAPFTLCAMAVKGGEV